MINTGHEIMRVYLFCRVLLHNPSVGFATLISIDTHNITFRAAYYPVECLYPLFFVALLAHMVQ